MQLDSRHARQRHVSGASIVLILLAVMLGSVAALSTLVA